MAEEPQAAKPAAAPAQHERYFVHREGREVVTGHKPLNGYTITMMHLIKGYIGSGIFAMGQAFKNSGLVVGTVLLVIIGFINLHCQRILIDSGKKLAEKELPMEVKPTFGEIVEYTFEDSEYRFLKTHSRGIAKTVNAFLILTELGFCCVYYVFIADHLLQIVHWFDASISVNIHVMLAFILVPMWITTFLGNLKLLAPLSIIANVMMLAAVGFVYYYLFTGLNKFGCQGQVLAAYKELPLYFGTALYAFEGITFVIPLRTEIRNPEKLYDSFFGVLNVGLVFVCIMLVITGVMGYWKYGLECKGSLFLNMPNHELPAFIGKILVALAIVFTFTLHMYIPFEVGYPIFYKAYGPFKHPYLVMMAYRTVPVLATFILACAVPFLDLFISLVGNTTASALAMILPPMLEIAWGNNVPYYPLKLAKNIFIILFGLVGSILGTGLSIYNIIQAFRSEYGDLKQTVVIQNYTC